jgi:NAD(P)-dependent dehydrogenase (short-subunit alcohol dehydrogenase family)
MPQDYLGSLFSAAGKTARVTGGATGIGRMVAEALVRSGARVLIASRKGDACELVAQELNALDAPGSAEGFAGDVATEAGVLALASDVKARTSRLHILVNNAGKTWGESLERFPHKAWDGVFSVNVAGLFTLTQQLLPLLEEAATDDDPARIVNLGSVMGAQPIGDNAYSYAASKAAVHHLTRILAKEFAERRITVNAFAPGPFQSRMTAFATGDEHKRALVAAGVPLGRIGRPEDIAGALLFLCGRGGAYTTGAIIPLDGGIGVETGHKIFGEAAE